MERIAKEKGASRAPLAAPFSLRSCALRVVFVSALLVEVVHATLGEGAPAARSTSVILSGGYGAVEVARKRVPLIDGTRGVVGNAGRADALRTYASVLCPRFQPFPRQSVSFGFGDQAVTVHELVLLELVGVVFPRAVGGPVDPCDLARSADRLITAQTGSDGLAERQPCKREHWYDQKAGKIRRGFVAHRSLLSECIATPVHSGYNNAIREGI